jgi:hypothetical protein
MFSRVFVAAVLVCAACSSESDPPKRELPSSGGVCAAGITQGCACGAGAMGTQTCATNGTWGACQCPMEPGNIDNPIDQPQQPFDAGMLPPELPDRECSPGLYLGTYECEIALFGFPVPLAGDVSFNLSINETTVDRECDETDEFCEDLVISENGGTLFGFAGFIGFETMLTGALDCRTGEFRAMGIGGRWGNAISTDPNDPNALWTVEDPPMGMFEGELMGMHAMSGSAETIAGEWNLRETAMGITCAGPFTVMLQP